MLCRYMVEDGWSIDQWKDIIPSKQPSSCIYHLLANMITNYCHPYAFDLINPVGGGFYPVPNYACHSDNHKAWRIQAKKTYTLDTTSCWWLLMTIFTNADGTYCHRHPSINQDTHKLNLNGSYVSNINSWPSHNWTCYQAFGKRLVYQH